MLQQQQNSQILQQQIPTPLVSQSQLIQSQPQKSTKQQQLLQLQTLLPQIVNTSMPQIIVNSGMSVTLNAQQASVTLIETTCYSLSLLDIRTYFWYTNSLLNSYLTSNG